MLVIDKPEFGCKTVFKNKAELEAKAAELANDWGVPVEEVVENMLEKSETVEEEIVICSNTEVLRWNIQGVLEGCDPDTVNEYVEAWYEAATEAAMEIAGDYHTDGIFWHYNGGCRTGVVEMYDAVNGHRGYAAEDSRVTAIIDAIWAAGNAAIAVLHARNRYMEMEEDI